MPSRGADQKVGARNRLRESLAVRALLTSLLVGNRKGTPELAEETAP